MEIIQLNYTKILTPTQVINEGSVVISEGKISYAGPMKDAPHTAGQVFDLQGQYTVPGLFDVHVHGGIGVAFGETGDPRRELETYSQWVPSTGVTHYLVSLAAPDAAQLTDKIAAFAEVLDAGVAGAQPVGLHLEGPYLNPKRKGVFNPDWLHAPSIQEVNAFVQAGRGWVRQMTLAPELPGAPEVAAYLRAEGITAALGHSDTDYETASRALNGDFTHVTHTFNAQSGFNHRQPGVFGAVLASERVTAELIADTIHVHPGAMKVLLRCLGSDQIVLITDAMSGAGLPDGRYEMVGKTVTVKDGRATLADGTIASSTTRLNQCVRNIHQHLAIPLAEAVKMGSLNPARAMGLDQRLGWVAPGWDANLIVIDEDVNVSLSMVNGQIVYQA